MAAVAVVACLTGPSQALAQGEGVFIDPNSPSAKEYAIPLEAERRAADPDQEPTTRIVQGERSSPPFGTGIVPEEEQSTGQGSSKPSPRDDDEKKQPRENEPDAIERPADRTVLEAAAADPGSPAGGVGMPLSVAGAALAVLLVGLLTGLLLRRRSG